MGEIEVFGNQILWISFSYMIVAVASFPFNLPLLVIVFRYLLYDGDERVAKYSKSWLLIKVYTSLYVVGLIYAYVNF